MYHRAGNRCASGPNYITATNRMEPSSAINGILHRNTAGKHHYNRIINIKNKKYNEETTHNTYCDDGPVDIGDG